MEEVSVRIVNLEPFKVISFHGFGNSPEMAAWEKAKSWLDSTQLLKDGKMHRFFGFNNPDPSPGSPNYGYDVWIVVDDRYQPGKDETLLDFKGGLYAVTGCKGVEAIGPTWQRFVKWRETSPYHFAHDHQWLEEHFNPFAPLDEILLDLYMPIRE